MMAPMTRIVRRISGAFMLQSTDKQDILSFLRAPERVSRHAKARMQQRGIGRSAVDRLLDFGREHHDHRGAVVIVLDRAATRRLARSGLATGREHEAQRSVYAGVSTDGCVCTVGHRTRRLHRT